jgi:general secretion pathway protein D
MGVTGDKNSNYRVGGGTSFSKDNNLLTLAAANSKTVGSALPGAGMTVGLFKQIGNQLGLGALAHALETDGNSNVLSIPNLLTLDNEEAKMIVGENVPFLTGSFTPASSGTAGANPFQTIERKEIGIKLTVKPQISEGGTVKMAIFQEVSSVDETKTNASGLITKQRSISTTVLVEDGQIIALGGLIKEDASGNVDKVPFLGDIPFLGNLFKYQTKGRKKTNLMVFLRPTVIRSAEQSASVSMNRYDYMSTQIAPVGAVGKESLLPKIEKGHLMSTTLSIPAEQANSASKESK